MAAPILAGQTLADPAGYRRRRGYRGGRAVMADGSLVIDLVNASAKMSWEMTWPALTDAQFTTLRTAFDALKNTSGAFTDIDGVAYTVTLAEDFDELERDAVRAKSGTRWASAIRLREV